MMFPSTNTIISSVLLASVTILNVHAQTCPPTIQNVKLTFYGWPDNDPPGAGIACEIQQRTTCNTCLSPSTNSTSFPTTTATQCGPRGETAGGTGTFSDPLSMASAGKWFCHQEVVYLPILQKYVRYEDSCQECINDANAGRKVHVDVWTGSNTRTGGQLQVDCENNLTGDGSVEMVRWPSANLSVNLTPLFVRTGNGTGMCNGTAVTGNTETAPGVTSSPTPKGSAAMLRPSWSLGLAGFLSVMLPMWFSLG